MTEYKLLKHAMLNEMAVSRKDWKAKVESSLMGAFGEYMTGKIADHFGLENAWAVEVKGLIKVVNRYFSKNIAFKNMKRAFKEVVEECDPEIKVNYAKRHLSSYYPNRHVEIFKLRLNAEREFIDFIERYIEIP